jgi:hypothetical protein
MIQQYKICFKHILALHRHTDEYNLVNFFGFREAKLFSNPKNLEEAIDDFGEIIMATCNSNGTKVSITIAKVQTIYGTSVEWLWTLWSLSSRYQRH